jgi:DNA-binding MarR family transcriptional regulator
MLFQRNHRKNKSCVENKVYIEGIVLLKKWHYLFLSHIKIFLEEVQNPDLSPRQALIIYSLGTRRVKVKDVVLDHFYEGCNPSYNIKKMTNAGYLLAHPCLKDRRIIYLSLGPKGYQVYTAMDSFLALYHKTLHGQGLFPSRFHKWIKEGLFLETAWRKVTLNAMNNITSPS